MPRSERLVKLMAVLHAQAGLDAASLASACGTSERTLRRDLDALTAAGVPVYFDHGYRLAAPQMLPPITLTVDEALALRLAAEAESARTTAAGSRALSVATQKLQHALAIRVSEEATAPQLALELPDRDSRTSALLSTLATAITERRSVNLVYLPTLRREPRSFRADPYRLLTSQAGWDLLAYCHDRRRVLRIPVSQLREASATRQRFRPMGPRLLERHMHRGAGTAAALQRVRVRCQPSLAHALREYPPAGTLRIEGGSGGVAILTLATLHMQDLMPWLLACGDAIEVLEPQALREEVYRTAHAMMARHQARTTDVAGSEPPGNRGGPKPPDRSS